MHWDTKQILPTPSHSFVSIIDNHQLSLCSSIKLLKTPRHSVSIKNEASLRVDSPLHHRNRRSESTATSENGMEKRQQTPLRQRHSIDNLPEGLRLSASTWVNFRISFKNFTSFWLISFDGPEMCWPSWLNLNNVDLNRLRQHWTIPPNETECSHDLATELKENPHIVAAALGLTILLCFNLITLVFGLTLLNRNVNRVSPLALILISHRFQF